MDLSPNSYNLNPKEEPYKYRPEIHKGNDVIYPKKKVWPRPYHKYLNVQTRNDIYGADEADRLYGNVQSVECEELTAAQIDFIRGEQRKY